MSPAVSPTRVVPAGPSELVSEAEAWLAAHGLPGRRDEAWRYAPVSRFRDAVAAAGPAPAATPQGAALAGVVGWHDAPTLVLVNGLWDEGLSIPGRAGTDGLLDSGPLRGIVGSGCVDGFDALNRVGHRSSALIATAPGAAEVLVQVVHLSVPSAGTTVAHPRTVVDVAPRSSLTLVETFVGGDHTMLTNAATVIRVGEGGHLRHHRVQVGDPSGLHVGHTHARLATGATLHLGLFELGAAAAHHRCDVVLAGDHATVTAAGLYSPGPDQHHDTLVRVEHAASDGTSRQHLRGVVADGGRGSFSGSVVVDAGTTGNDASQANHSLLLGRHAEADSRPWLEIHSDDVRCSHGSSVGRLDDDALFYLRSRGIDRATARRMLIDAFVADALGAISPPQVATWVSGLFDAAHREVPR